MVPPLKVWFEDGLDTPGLILIKVCADTAEYWESPSSKVVRLLGGLRAVVAGDPLDRRPAGCDATVGAVGKLSEARRAR